MKSKKLSHNKTPYNKPNVVWPPPLPINKRISWPSSQNMSQGSKVFSDNISNTFIAINLLAINTTMNPDNDSFLSPY